MIMTEIWQHLESDNLYLVRVSLVRVETEEDLDYMEILAACGPLSQQEAEYTINEASGWFANDEETADWIAEHTTDFQIIFPQ